MQFCSRQLRGLPLWSAPRSGGPNLTLAAIAMGGRGQEPRVGGASLRGHEWSDDHVVRVVRVDVTHGLQPRSRGLCCSEAEGTGQPGAQWAARATARSPSLRHANLG